MRYLYPLVLVALLIAPLVWIRRRHRAGKTVRTQLICQIFMFFAVGLCFAGVGIQNVFAAETADVAGAATASGVTDKAFGMIAAALSTGLSGIGGGIAVAGSASAALGAISENDKLFGKSIIFVGMAEGIALFGMIISFMILGNF